ncbi:YHYH protein [Winogradskyella thalassocola]|uniref:YHYH protein n=1 Tax=Winogradskyella thalassocola TaxID=262004 RepID=A0A1G8AYP3_9FLAO|nr:YHYH protein [Winogradskyella thalassocola]SDH26058.1 YHYH protein [Winogradskyella thalassocola]
MKIYFKPLTYITIFAFALFSCSSDDSSSDDSGGNDDDDDDVAVTELHAAFAAFNLDAVTAILSDDGTEVYIETTGFPDHTSIYWETDNALYMDEPGVSKTTQDTYIGGGQGEAASFTVDATPNLTGSTVTTQLNTIGIAVSGASIFNDQEGMGDLDQAAGSLDWAGAHKGPGVYHYHLEPTPITNDDESLVGILLDGVFIYGRQCSSTGTYPTDLDASGGHTSTTQYTDGAEEYHYHIVNEEYPAGNYAYDPAYVLFAGPFQGY